MYRVPDVFLQFGAEVFEFPMYNRPANLRLTGPILTKQKEAIEPPEWLQELDGSKAVVFVTQGIVANFNFDQLVNPALAGLANDDVQFALSAKQATTNELMAAAYNSNAAKLPGYIRRGGASWRTLIPRETQTYLQILQSYDSLMKAKENHSRARRS